MIGNLGDQHERDLVPDDCTYGEGALSSHRGHKNECVCEEEWLFHYVEDSCQCQWGQTGDPELHFYGFLAPGIARMTDNIPTPNLNTATDGERCPVHGKMCNI